MYEIYETENTKRKRNSSTETWNKNLHLFPHTSVASQIPHQQSLLGATYSEMQLVLSSIGQIIQRLEKLNILGVMNATISYFKS